MKRSVLLALSALIVSFSANTQTLPPGSDRAVAAFHTLYPLGVLDDIRRPGENDLAGGAGGDILYWIFRFHEKGNHEEALISPGGLLIRHQEPCAKGDLPGAVAGALKKRSAQLKHILKQETFATLKFLEAPSPRTSYILTVEKGKEKSQMSIDSAAVVRHVRTIADRETEEEESGAAPVKEMPVPERAAAAVKAVKSLYPEAILEDVEDVAYDDKTGNIEVAYFEVEISLAGKPKTLLATPEGVLLSSKKSLKIADLPPAVAAAVSREMPGALILTATEQKELTAPAFVGLALPPRVVYLAEFSGGELTRYSAEGKIIKPLTLK